MDCCRAKPSDLSQTWWDVMRGLVLYSDHCWGLSMFGWYKMVSADACFCDEVFERARYSWQSKARHADDALNLVRRKQDIQMIENVRG